MADLRKRVKKLETEEKVKEGPRGFRVIVSDAGREDLPSDDLCIRAITEEWSSRATAGFVVQVIDVGTIPNDITPETERLLFEHGWRQKRGNDGCLYPVVVPR
jgi:hypothetical protein